jgi:hypothetical protein
VRTAHEDHYPRRRPAGRRDQHQSQTAPLGFEQSVYVTCREAQAMNVEARKSLAVFLAEHSALNRGVHLPDGERGAYLALLVRGGCTLGARRLSFHRDQSRDRGKKEKLPKLNREVTCVDGSVS